MDILATMNNTVKGLLLFAFVAIVVAACNKAPQKEQEVDEIIEAQGIESLEADLDTTAEKLKEDAESLEWDIDELLEGIYKHEKSINKNYGCGSKCTAAIQCGTCSEVKGQWQGTPQRWSAPGDYWLEIDSLGYTMSDSFEIVNKPNANINLGNDTTICCYDSLILDAFYPSATYNWSNGETTYKTTALDVGEYIVQVSLDHCVTTDTINISQTTVDLFLGTSRLSSVYCNTIR